MNFVWLPRFCGPGAAARPCAHLALDWDFLGKKGDTDGMERALQENNPAVYGSGVGGWGWEWSAGREGWSSVSWAVLKPACGDFPGDPVIKDLPCNAGTQVRFLDRELRSQLRFYMLRSN